jgi:hypothetical protein
MKAKAFLTVLAVSLGMTSVLAQNRVISGMGTRTVVTNNFRPAYCHGGDVSLSIGVGFPFYGGYYGGYPYYGGFYPSYSYGYYPAGYGYGSYSAPYYGAPVYGSNYRGSTITRVQERLARAGYYAGAIDGIMGPRTRSAIRAYERRHRLPVDGVIDSRLLATMELA